MIEDQNTRDGFLQRWSERKQSSRTAESLSARVDDTPTADAEAASLPAQTPGHELTDADMPPLESLDEHSDFSGFLSPKVSEALQRQALRKLFNLPSFNVTDGLNDYDEDYTRSNVLIEWVSGKLAEREKWHDVVTDGEAAPEGLVPATSRAAEGVVPDEEDKSNDASINGAKDV